MISFVDTNLLIYAHDADAGVRRDRARAVLGELWEEGTGRLSTQVLQEFYVNVTRKLAKPLDATEAQALLNDYCAWQVYSLRPADVVAAATLETAHQVSFWDGLIIVAAQRCGAARLLSEDLQHGRQFGALTIINPFVG